MKKYIAQNAGIFTFELGYLINKAYSVIEFDDYQDLFNKYDSLMKISFDYAAVEKSHSSRSFAIAVTGRMSALGT